MNSFTKYLSLTLDFLFLRHPTRTSLGFLFGVTSRTILKILAIWIIAIQTILATSISVWEFGLLGICIAHFPTVKEYFSGKTNYLSENEEKAFAMIRNLNIPDYQKQNMYLKVVEKVLERVELKPEFQEEIKKHFG
jgi:hypothetical protein